MKIPNRRWPALFLLLLAGVVYAEPPAGIHVSGRGTLEVIPDMGDVQLHVRREGTQAESLKTALDDVVRRVLELTRSLDIDERDVTASAISINPRYQRRGGEPAVEGLVATRSIAITLRDLDRFGELINGSLALGINNLDPIRLDTSRRSALEDEALALAMADAQQEAARVAGGFNVELGPVRDVNVAGHSPRPDYRSAVAMAEAAGGDFSPGVIRIERMLTATFAIIPGE